MPRLLAAGCAAAVSLDSLKDVMKRSLSYDCAESKDQFIQTTRYHGGKTR